MTHPLTGPAHLVSQFRKLEFSLLETEKYGVLAIRGHVGDGELRVVKALFSSSWRKSDRLQAHFSICCILDFWTGVRTKTRGPTRHPNSTESHDYHTVEFIESRHSCWHTYAVRRKGVVVLHFRFTDSNSMSLSNSHWMYRGGMTVSEHPIRINDELKIW